jgi:hypothetical protein
VKALALPALAALAIGCARPAHDVASIESRTLRVAGDPPMHAIAFPPRVAGRARTPLVVVEPILWKRDLLLKDGGLVAWLEDEGFPVWLVGTDAASPPDARALGAGIARTATALARAARLDRVDLVATGLSGDAALSALEGLTAPSSPVQVGRVAFVGAPLDLAYPGDLRARVAGSTLAFHDRAAVGWLGVVPPADPAEAKPARERFPFVARLDVPVLFVAGKSDGIAPSESVFPVFKLWGTASGGMRPLTKGFFLVGRENGLDVDADAFDLFDGGDAAVAAWERLEGFLED